MKLTLADPKILKDAVAIISELVTEARFSISKDAMELVALDPATVAMVDFKLLASAFTEYDVTDKEDIALNLMQFKHILRRIGPSDTLVLEKENEQLKVTIKGASTRTFQIRLLDLEDEKRRSPPKVDYTATVTCLSQNLADAIDDVDLVADSVAFSAKDKLFTVSAEGDLSKANIELPADQDTKVVVQDTVDGEKVQKPVRARFSVEYLKKMVQGGKLADKVTVQFRTDHPLRLEYKVLNKVVLSFILAPRVEND